jgi:hypothetical protein
VSSSTHATKRKSDNAPLANDTSAAKKIRPSSNVASHQLTPYLKLVNNNKINCFANVAVQLIWHLTSIGDLLKGRSNLQVNNNARQRSRAVQQELVKLLCEQSNDTTQLRRKVGGNYGLERMQDAGEFFLSVLEQLAILFPEIQDMVQFQEVSWLKCAECTNDRPPRFEDGKLLVLARRQERRRLPFQHMVDHITRRESVSGSEAVECEQLDGTKPKHTFNKWHTFNIKPQQRYLFVHVSKLEVVNNQTVPLRSPITDFNADNQTAFG